MGLELPEETVEKLCAFGTAVVKQNEVMNLTAITKPVAVAKLHLLDSLTLLSCADVKGKTYILMSRGIANYDADTDLEDYEPEDFFAEDAQAPEIEDAIVIVGGEPTASGKIEREGNIIRINCGEKLACLCLESGKEFYV